MLSSLSRHSKIFFSRTIFGVGMNTCYRQGNTNGEAPLWQNPYRARYKYRKLKDIGGFSSPETTTPINLGHMLTTIRYLRWAKAVQDRCGVSHANVCLARVYEIMGDEDNVYRHRNVWLDGCRQRVDIDDQGKVRHGDSCCLMHYVQLYARVTLCLHALYTGYTNMCVRFGKLRPFSTIYPDVQICLQYRATLAVSYRFEHRLMRLD